MVVFSIQAMPSGVYISGVKSWVRKRSDSVRRWVCVCVCVEGGRGSCWFSGSHGSR